MMPELDSHRPSPSNSDPVMARLSPWHACGKDFASYSAGMKRCSHLRFLGAECRLAPDDSDTEAASRQWKDLFDITRNGSELVFTNARVRFVPGVEGQAEGLVSITIGVQGKQKFDGILDRARAEGLCGNGWINMLGVRWYFVLLGETDGKSNL
jgi:hypothetical protein